MVDRTTPRFSVSDFIAVTNQVLEMSFPAVEVEGEIASFKVNQGKYVFFDIKDDGGSIGCFMMVWQLRVALEDGMKVVVRATPKLTPWGKFSLTIQAVHPRGEGSLKKSFELLKARLEKEGLFAPERKRLLPSPPRHVAVISSTQAAGYADFIKILNDRWGGLQVDVAHVQVQGSSAPDQMIRALEYFNTREDLPEVIVLIRGGGSADDLAAFNDEKLVREIAASRVPTIVGVGHEVDVSLADLAADVRAATPSNAAQLLVPDRRDVVQSVRRQVAGLLPRMQQTIQYRQQEVRKKLERAFRAIDQVYRRHEAMFDSQRKVLAELDPRRVLARGYALVRGELVAGGMIEVEKSDVLIRAEVKDVRKK